MGHPTETAEVMNYLLEAVGKERIRQLQREAAHYRFARRADRRRTRRTWRFRSPERNRRLALREGSRASNAEAEASQLETPLPDKASFPRPKEARHAGC